MTAPTASPDVAAPPGPLRGPAFGSYDAGEVGWLVTDLSEVPLEAPPSVREVAIQSGVAGYAESLPIEYQPSEEYQRLFATVLAASAHRTAHLVGVLTELVLAERGDVPVLVSLARAGTPIGVLMRRWVEHRHGIRPAHYAVSVVRSRGLDQAAMHYLAEHHAPRDVVFVDGWTGKGVITREVAGSVPEVNRRLDLAPGDGFRADVAVLADPGGCSRLYATREDVLIPSACLNSTVSGLVSRTVLNDALIRAPDFHGAKFYRELAPADVSRHFVDTVAAAFDDVVDGVAATWPLLAATDREPTWAGWAAVRRIAGSFGIRDPNLVKPGVGETTRVLLRRVPWRVLLGADDDGGADLEHVRLLARDRGVELRQEPNLPFRCVGLIRPWREVAHDRAAG